MRAPGLLLPLLPLLLLLGVSSDNVADPGSPGENLPTTTTKTSMVTTPTSNSGTPPSTPTLPSTTVQKTTLKTTLTPQPSVSTTPTVQATTTTSNPGKSPSPSMKSPAAGAHSPVAGTTPTNTFVNPLPTTTKSTPPPGQNSPSAGPSAAPTTPAAQPGTAQQPSNPTASLGHSTATTAASSADVSSPAAAAPSPPSTQPQGSQPSDHLPVTNVSTGVSTTKPSQVTDCAVSTPPCVTKQPHSSSAQGPTPSTSLGSTSTSVSPLMGSPSVPTTKPSPMSQPGSTDKVSEAATTPTSGADQRTPDAGSASAKPTSASQSPASAQPAAPPQRNQTDQAGSCSPGQQHPNISLQNELICEEHVKDTRPTIHLKEGKTCADWKTESSNISFFESFCSTAQHVFNASRDKCTVKLTACKPRSQYWAVGAVLHLTLDPETVLEELKEKKDKLEELGIVNITYDKLERDMDIKDELSTPLIITIVTLAGSLLLIAAIYGCCHQRFSQKKDQHIHPDLPGFDDGHVALIFNQRLTEELQTMENGYHDNPTLEVMETSSEMQEKKVNLNGELGDSWIVPLDTLMKEDLEEEEDTHL